MVKAVNYYNNPATSIPWGWGILGDEQEDGWVVLKALLPSDLGSHIISPGRASEYAEALVHEVANVAPSVTRLKPGHHVLLLLNGGMKGVKDSSIVCAKAKDIVMSWNPGAWVVLKKKIDAGEKIDRLEARVNLSE